MNRSIPMSQRPNVSHTGNQLPDSLSRDPRQPLERRHDGSGWWTFGFEICCVLLACGLIVAHLVALWQQRSAWTYWQWLVIGAAWVAADFVSGVVHWLADTWGSEKFPILGPRFIRPFRVHHQTPSSFLTCNFFDTNGDTCLIAIPILLSLYWLSPDSMWGLLALTFGVSFCMFAIPTNQIHQWAHMPHPPRWVRILQSWGLLLSNEEHSQHHQLPFEGHYCITSGLCNRWLERIHFFRGLEKLITQMTGVLPRMEEQQELNEQ